MMAHKHGDMDISDQQQTFDGFVTWMTRFGIATVVLVIFLALAGA